MCGCVMIDLVRYFLPSCVSCEMELVVSSDMLFHLSEGSKLEGGAEGQTRRFEILTIC